jgi:hypothetical protein
LAKSKYRAGYLIELKAKDDLLKKGASIVVRSSRSLSPADLIAIFPDQKEIWLVQCKKEEAPKDTSRLTERFKDLKALEGTYTCKAYAYMKKDGKYTFLEV